MKDTEFEACLSEDEAIAWDSIKAVIEFVLGKHRSGNYNAIVDTLMDTFDQIGIHMSLKIHLLRSHLNYFARQLPTESDEHGERFHQQIMTMEERYKGKKLDQMLADFCWESQSSA